MVTQDSSHFSLEMIKKGVKPIKKNQSKRAIFDTMEKGSTEGSKRELDSVTGSNRLLKIKGF